MSAAAQAVGSAVPGPPNFAHLRRLTTAKGVFEHCKGEVPRPEHGYCTDDVARALIVAAREPVQGRDLQRMTSGYLDFLSGAYRGGGCFVNRRDVGGRWVDDGANDDASGRAVWALGEAATRLRDAGQRTIARHLFVEACQFRSPFLRPTAYAVIGAAAMTAADPSHVGAAQLLAEAAASTELPGDTATWPWPEPRLTYGNAVVPEMLLLLGRELRLQSFIVSGLHMLRWLVATETSSLGWLSVTPTSGWAPGEARPAFDQQPIEVAALADASATTWSLTGDPVWAREIIRCGGWFAGMNDGQIPMVDPHNGGGFDGLTVEGRNDNRGAESTIAALTTLQWVRAAIGVVA